MTSVVWCRTHSELLFDVLNGCLQSSGPLCGFVLHGLHRLQEGRYIGDHHLQHQVNISESLKYLHFYSATTTKERSAGTGVTVKPLYSHKSSPLVLPLYPRNIKHLQLCPQCSCRHPVDFSRWVFGCSAFFYFLRGYLGRVLELEHAGVIVRLPCCCFGGADQVGQSFGYVLHCIDEDHLQNAAETVT